MDDAAKQVEDTPSPSPDILVAGHFKERDGYAVYRSHGSGNWLITYTLHGRGLYRQPGLQQWAAPGDIVLLQPNALHDYSVPPDGSWEFLWAHFQPRPSWLAWWRLPEVGHGLFIAHLPNTPLRERVQHAFLTLLADTSVPPINALSIHAQQADETRGMLQRELALNGLEEVLLLAIRTQGHQALDPRVQHILDLITGDLSAPYNLEALAHEVALSPSRLAHLFKQEVGDSLQHMLLVLRLNSAARLLEFTPHSIGMIATTTGFSSAFYFSRQFSHRFGMSPRAYRIMTTAQQGMSEPAHE